MPVPAASRPVIPISRREAARVARLLRSEFAAGLLVIAAAFLGFLAANTPFADIYFAVRELRVGPAMLDLNLSLGEWASDGLLAIFFFMVGLELKREFTVGALRNPSTAIVPVAAALGGVAAPALLYLVVIVGSSTSTADAAHGWAIPTATDIAFAVAVLGLIAPRIPPALRVFLLTLAVVDDFIAIAIIALFYGDGVRWIWLAAALIPLLLYALLAQLGAAWFTRHRWAAWLVLLPLGGVVWALVHASGLHATIAGVLLAFAVPVVARDRRTNTTVDRVDLADTFGYRFGPLSSGIAVPVFAFFAAGVALSGASRFPIDPIAIGIMLGLVLGKPLGIVATTLLLTRFTQARLGDSISLRELIGVGCLGGIGFTVALLISGLSFTDPADADTARLAVMAGSVLAATIAALFLLRRRSRNSAH